MKLILRCALAVAALAASVTNIWSAYDVDAQSCCNPDTCPQPPPNCPTPVCDYLGGCSFAWECDSPILIDLRGEGFHLTSQSEGVQFQFFGNTKQSVAWTNPAYGNAWLALDRNGNGTIDNATELFGNYTPQPPSPEPNGFLALAVYDLPENGGNGDGYITAADKIYSHLLAWTDLNHNGLSEPDELQTLSHAGVLSVNLNYKEAHREDQFGNIFKFRSTVRADAVPYDHQIYDVYLVGTN